MTRKNHFVRPPPLPPAFIRLSLQARRAHLRQTRTPLRQTHLNGHSTHTTDTGTRDPRWGARSASRGTLRQSPRQATAAQLTLASTRTQLRTAAGPDKHHRQRPHQAGHPSHGPASPPSITSCLPVASSPSSTSRPGRRLCSRHTSQSHVSTHSPAHARSLCTGSAARRSTTTGAEGTTTSACFGAGSGAGATTRTISGTTPSYHRSGRAGAGTKTGSNATRATTSTRIPCCAAARSYPVSSPANNPPARIPGADTAAINTTGRLRT